MMDHALESHEAPSALTAIHDALPQADDQTLQALIKEAQSLLDERTKSRKHDALAEIRRLAKAHGLDVSVNGRAPRRRKQKPNKTATKPRMAGFVLADEEENST